MADGVATLKQEFRHVPQPKLVAQPPEHGEPSVNFVALCDTPADVMRRSDAAAAGNDVSEPDRIAPLRNLARPPARRVAIAVVLSIESTVRTPQRPDSFITSSCAAVPPCVLARQP